MFGICLIRYTRDYILQEKIYTIQGEAKVFYILVVSKLHNNLIKTKNARVKLKAMIVLLKIPVALKSCRER